MAKKTTVFDNLQSPEILWKDRKRILGMPISFTKYSVDNERLYISAGLFSTESNELLLYRILDFSCKRTLWQKMFGVGTVTLYSADQSDHTLALVNIKKPEQVKQFLSQLVEKERESRGLIGREIYGTAHIGMDHDGCDHDDMDPII
ncbi:MAG: PH domain-containing protein [Clostridia bacterium]|nr:PH domain-containing protein [Clostridia bacterium]